MQRTLQRRYAPIPLVICLSLTSLLLTACGGTTPPKTSTIGVVNYYAALEPVLAGFKDQMAALVLRFTISVQVTRAGEPMDW